MSGVESGVQSTRASDHPWQETLDVLRVTLMALHVPQLSRVQDHPRQSADDRHMYSISGSRPKTIDFTV